MKKLALLLLSVLLITTGCDLFPSAEETYSIKAVCDSNGVITPSSVTVSKGETVKFTIAPFEGCIVKNITVDDKPVTVPNDNILYLSNISSDHKVKVIIEKSIEYFIINSSCGPNGTISPSGDVSVVKDQAKTFEILASTGYFVDSLYIDGVGTKTSSATAGISYKFSSISDNHTISVTFRKKESYKITSSASSNGVISPLGEVSVTEGQTKTFQTTANELCSLQKLVVDGVDVNPSSNYTFSEINANHTIDAIFVKEPEWYICKITWVLDSVYVDQNHFYLPWVEVANFSSDGTCITVSHNQTYNFKWVIDKTVNPPTLQTIHGVCKIEVLSNNKMVISDINTGLNQKVTYVYHGILK